MGFARRLWEGRRVGGRVPRSFAPNVGRFQRRSVAPGWLGFATVVGLALAAWLVSAWWQSIDDGSDGWPDAPIEWNEVQDVPRPLDDVVDEAWRERGRDGGYADAGSPAPGAGFGLCHSGGGTNCVVDGDTLWIGGEKVRLADIDAPETHEPRCAAEQALGNRATMRLHALVNGGAITMSGIGRDADGYGRKLRIVAVDGVSVGETLVGEGLARWYAGGRRSWCA